MSRADPASFVSGYVTDEDEMDRITQAIRCRPELEEAFLLLMHGEDEAAADPDHADAMSAEFAMTRMQLRGRAG